MGMASCDLDPKEAASIGPVVIEVKKFKNIETERFGPRYS